MEKPDAPVFVRRSLAWADTGRELEFFPTIEQREQVRKLRSEGQPLAVIRRAVLWPSGAPIEGRALRKHFHAELEQGDVDRNSAGTAGLLKLANKGNTAAGLAWVRSLQPPSSD